MAHCPVCKTECGENTKCVFCGFNDVNRVFINKEEAIQWEQTILEPYKNTYFASIETKEILKINGSRLVKYYKRSKAERVVIPDYITEISPNAFRSCDTIKHIFLPDSITELPDYAFLGCTSLESVRLSENIRNIPRSAFSLCINLKEIYIPKSVTNIHDEAFSYCVNLKKIIISSENENIQLIDNVLISNGVLVKMIEDENIQTIIIPNGVTAIENGSLNGYYNFRSLQLPESLKFIGLHAFWGRSKLKEIFIPKNVEYIGANAFAGCDAADTVVVHRDNKHFRSVGNCIIDTKNLEIVQGFASSKIPSDGSVTKIAVYSFHDIKREKPLIIPKTIEHIDARAFESEFDIFCDFEQIPETWERNWCDSSHKGKVFLRRNDGCRYPISREDIE